MNKYQKKITREAKRIHRDVKCSYKRARIVAREFYKILYEIIKKDGGK